MGAPSGCLCLMLNLRHHHHRQLQLQLQLHLRRIHQPAQIIAPQPPVKLPAAALGAAAGLCQAAVERMWWWQRCCLTGCWP